MITCRKGLAIYCRVACADEKTMKRQEQALLDYAEKNAYNDVHCYRDNGASGLLLERQGMKRLVCDIKSGMIETVLVYDMTRITRNYAVMGQWIGFLGKYGVDLVLVTDEFRSLTDDNLFNRF